MASKKIRSLGNRKLRRAFNRRGQDVVDTRRSMKETEVATRKTRKAAVRAPCSEMTTDPIRIQLFPGVRKRAGMAIKAE